MRVKKLLKLVKEKKVKIIMDNNFAFTIEKHKKKWIIIDSNMIDFITDTVLEKEQLRNMVVKKITHDSDGIVIKAKITVDIVKEVTESITSTSSDNKPTVETTTAEEEKDESPKTGEE